MEKVIDRIRANIAGVVIGMEEVTDLLLAAFLAGGHVLLEDMPGTGKTLLSKSLAKSMDCSFGRIQFTPDLLPGDVTGISYYDQGKREFIFRKGPIFANIVLADEINRATPRTQSALLECMGEGQVTVDAATRKLEEPFMVIATENPVETFGCFPLPEAQLDRFLMKLHMGTLTADEERKMLDRFMNNEPLESLSPVLSLEEAAMLRQKCREVFVHEDLKDYIVRLIQSTRKGESASGIREGISPRGTLALLRASQGYAMTKSRDFVTPEDIKAAAVPVLAHRYICDAGDGMQKEQKIAALLASVSVPTESWKRP